MTFETEPLLCTSLNMIVEGNLRKQMLCNSEFTYWYLRNSRIKQPYTFVGVSILAFHILVDY